MIQSNHITHISPVQDVVESQTPVTRSERGNGTGCVPSENVNVAERAASFQSVFQDKIFDNLNLQFSKHAGTRLNARGISLSAEQIKRVEDGVNIAKAKGIKDSLVLMDNLAFLVNVKSKTVITAMNQESENVYTNIDGAVIV